MTRRKQTLLIIAIITKIQSIWRMEMVKRFPLKAADASMIDYQNASPSHSFRLRKNTNLHELKSAVKIQKIFRGFLLREKLSQFISALRSVQSHVRGRKTQ